MKRAKRDILNYILTYIHTDQPSRRISIKNTKQDRIILFLPFCRRYFTIFSSLDTIFVHFTEILTGTPEGLVNLGGGQYCPLTFQRLSSKNYLSQSVIYNFQAVFISKRYFGHVLPVILYFARARTGQRAHYSKFFNEIYKAYILIHIFL